ncbi:histidine kinase [bacterium]|nr:histidine kinase [bacterium]
MKNTSFMLMISLLLSVSLFAKDLRFDQLSVEQGLSQSSVLSICQDKTGFMWFGTYEGLNRYDGYQFKVYHYDATDVHSLSQNVVRSIVVDPDGALWAATEGGLNRYDSEQDRFIRYRHDPEDPASLAHDRIRNLYIDHSGVLWISTDNGLSRYDASKDHFINYRHDPDDPASLSNSRVRCVYEDHRGSVWVGTDDGLNLFRAEDGKFAHFQHDPSDPHSISEDLIVKILEDSHQQLWIGTWGGGLCRYDFDSGRFIRYAYSADDPASIGHYIIRDFLEDRAGNLWVATYGGGLNLYDREHDGFIRYTNNPDDPNSLSSDALFRIYEDRSGMLWIGTDFGGVNMLDRRKAQFFTYFTSGETGTDLRSNTINTIYMDPEDSRYVVWIGTWGSGLVQFNRDRESYTIYKNDPRDPGSIGSDIVRWISRGSRDCLWIGTENGLSRFHRKTGRFDNYPFQSINELDMDYDNVFAVLEDSRHQVWVGSYYGGLHRFDLKTRSFYRYPVKPDDPSTINDYIVWFIYEDTGGSLWIGTETAGLYEYNQDSKQFKGYQKDTENSGSISSNKVLCIYEDKSGIFWVGTTTGLNRFDRFEEQFTTYTTEQGLPGNAIQSIQEDDSGYLWISTTRGLSRFDRETETFLNFSMSDGLPSNEFYVNSSCRGKQGDMFFGSINGLTVFKAEDIHINPHVPPVLITDFKIFNESVPIGPWHKGRSILEKSIWATDRLELNHDENVLSFEFSALDFTSPEKNEYAYIMEGLETEWNEVGNRHFATYSRLPAGEYTFRVSGSNNNNIWNKTGSSVHILIRPAFWNTTGFRLTVFLMICALAVSVHRYRVGSIRRRNLQLEQMNKKLNEEIRIREAAEAKVQTSLQEKEVLLKEIHHRVKNNMQIICSLLSLQSNRIQDEDLRSLFIESQNRVRAMALIHERLYKTKDLHSINFRNYLEDLAQDLMTSYSGTTDVIRLNMDIDEIVLPVNLAVPCGLVINELISNAIKYAFPAERSIENQISVRMQKKGDDVVLTVEDNGIGLKVLNKNKNEDALGLKLVEILVNQQLRGELVWDVDHGTRFTVRFNGKA